MSEFSDFFENKIIDHLLRNVAYTPPATIYVALFTAVTGLESNAPTAEVAVGSYARVAVTLTAASAGAADNTADVVFPTATADWGTITHFAIMDALTLGNVLLWSPVTTAQAVNNTNVAKFLLGTLDITID